MASQILVLVTTLLMTIISTQQVQCNTLSDAQLEEALRTLLSTTENPSLQLQALRQELLHIIREQSNSLPNYYDYNIGNEDKRSIANLAKNGQLPTHQSPEESTETEEEKRNVASLARAGLIGNYMREPFDEETSQYKRHLGSLLKQYESKRNLGALARNGELISGKRNVQSIMRDRGTDAGKRNIGSLLRNQNYYPFGSEKRNIGSIARDWSLPNHSNSWAKRNAAALLRQDSYLQTHSNENEQENSESSDIQDDENPLSKKSLASIKAHYNYFGRPIQKRSVKQRNKRQTEEFNADPENAFYDNFMQYLSNGYNNYEKRFLGNIPLSRMADLGKLSMMNPEGQIKSTPSSPTYRRRQYLLARPGTDR